MKCLILFLLALCVFTVADEQKIFPLKLASGEILQITDVLDKTEDGISAQTADRAVKFIKYTAMSPDFQKAYGYEPSIQQPSKTAVKPKFKAATGSEAIGKQNAKAVTGVIQQANPPVSTDTVFITNAGSKYHKTGCRYLRSSTEISLDDAKAKGYVPCSGCCASPAVESEKQPPTGETTGETTTNGKTIYTGPRGGRYHYSKSGKKVYERK